MIDSFSNPAVIEQKVRRKKRTASEGSVGPEPPPGHQGDLVTVGFFCSVTGAFGLPVLIGTCSNSVTD